MPIVRTHRRAAFTLIELLVSIAIIGLLLSLVAPSLAAARRQSYKVVCQTQLRSLAAMVEMYVQRDDAYPDAAAFPYGPNAIQDISQHANCLAIRLHPMMPDTPTRVAETWYCPVKGAVPLPEGLRVFGHGTYPYNAGSLHAAPTGRIARTSEVGLQRDYVAYDLIVDVDDALRYGDAHEGGQNISYVDGHVEYSVDPRYFIWGPEESPAFPGY
ncbi:MAG: type II secretion system protein [Phycisphaerae bacterium]|nr:type II secretion system GspH family protein [Phycisphaerae bacterium]NUQ45946.1 type II secretion system protein [Phycisphaerae bacterium]